MSWVLFQNLEVGRRMPDSLCFSAAFGLPVLLSRSTWAPRGMENFLNLHTWHISKALTKFWTTLGVSEGAAMLLSTPVFAQNMPSGNCTTTAHQGWASVIFNNYGWYCEAIIMQLLYCHMMPQTWRVLHQEPTHFGQFSSAFVLFLAAAFNG